MPSYPLFLLINLNFILASASLIITVAAVALLVDHFFYKGKYLDTHVSKVAWITIIFMTIGSVALSLLYSEYFGFIPCSLCWLQRIAIYPQALIALMAFRHKDDKHFPAYGIGLSIFGFVVAVYQYIYQMWPKSEDGSGLIPCLADSIDADCAAKIIDQFGFVTFPYISAVTFLLLIALYLHLLRSQKSEE